jgi:hypothetical protein
LEAQKGLKQSRRIHQAPTLKGVRVLFGGCLGLIRQTVSLGGTADQGRLLPWQYLMLLVSPFWQYFKGTKKLAP